jgi:CrcB protein
VKNGWNVKEKKTVDFIFVGLGGAIGAMLRYIIGKIPYRGEFPLTTLLINMIGAVLIGYIAITAEQKGISNKAVLFLKTGLCGGFTTFSTFSLESYTLIENGHTMMAGVYTLLSVVLCLLGIWLGMKMAGNV